MSAKRSGPDVHTLTVLRRTAGRYASKFSHGGREKRVTRAMPSLPKLNWPDDSEVKENDGARLSHQGPYQGYRALSPGS